MAFRGRRCRYFTRQKAREYGVTGWCRNTTDNKVRYLTFTLRCVTSSSSYTRRERGHHKQQRVYLVPVLQTVGKDQTLANRASMRVREQVEGEAQGEDDALQKFFKDVDDGPRHARVVQLTKEDRAVVEDETSFSVRH